MNRTVRWVLLVLLVVFIAALYFLTFNATPQGQAQARTDIVQMFNALAIGDTRQTVESKFKRINSKYLGLPRTQDEKEWLITTPGEWGATNWLIWVEFCGDRVASVGTRLADGKEFHPSEAPPDKGKRAACP